MTTISLSCSTAAGHSAAKPITFSQLYELKAEWSQAIESTESAKQTDLLSYLYDTLDSINNDVLRQNKIRFKQYQKQKQGATTSNNGEDQPTTSWRVNPAPKISGLAAQLSGVDKVKFGINRELNKLTPMNGDAIFEAVLDIFCEFVVSHITSSGTESVRDTSFLEKWQSHVAELWNCIINKLLTQANFSDTYFRFINKLIITDESTIMNIISKKLATCLETATIPKVVGDLYSKLSFSELETRKRTLITEMIAFMKNSNYLVANGKTLIGLLGGNQTHLTESCEITFNTLGRFVKYFSEIEYVAGRSTSKRMSRAEKVAYDILLLALYDNFKHINEILQWEPINHAELEKRVYFTIGFFQDNKRFIQGLDMDFYRDMECQLDSLKHMDNIPTTIKYKLFDCIDNFITARHQR